MNIVAEALGSYYYNKAVSSSLENLTRKAVAHFRQAQEKFEEALRSNPCNATLLRKTALCCTRLLELEVSGGVHQESACFDLAAAATQKTDQYYIRAVAANSEDPISLYSYAKFLWRCGRLERAEEYFLQCLEADATFQRALRDYGSLLAELGHAAGSERFLLFASQQPVGSLRG